MSLEMMAKLTWINARAARGFNGFIHPRDARHGLLRIERVTQNEHVRKIAHDAAIDPLGVTRPLPPAPQIISIA